MKLMTVAWEESLLKAGISLTTFTGGQLVFIGGQKSYW